jgi:glutamate/tyrosine decarboxylase-like PLP-dependent enzyme
LNRFEPYLSLLKNSLKNLDSWRDSFGSDQNSQPVIPQHDELTEIITQLQKRLQNNYPFHHPQYAGQMLKPPHPVAWLAYTLAMTVNPNNHALDGGPPTSEMEKEVIAQIAEMVGYKSGYLGHLTSAGTIANLEALFAAREIHPDKAIAATTNAHYTHRRMCRVLGCDFIEIPVDENNLPDFRFIEKHADQIGTLVVTMGTTGLGSVEPLKDLTELASRFGVRIHADAAYGGFYKLMEEELPSVSHWNALHLCDSIVIDPHKHGLQPYGCGSVLYKDASVGTFFSHDSPYTYFTSDELHLGEISLECSRAGASAAALWATLKLLPLSKTGLGQILKKTRAAALRFSGRIQQSAEWELYCEPDLDIVSYFKVPGNATLRDLNRLSRQIFNEGMKSRKKGFHLSLYKIPASTFTHKRPHFKPDAPDAVILRSVLMKEEHLGFADELADRLFAVKTD